VYLVGQLAVPGVVDGNKLKQNIKGCMFDASPRCKIIESKELTTDDSLLIYIVIH